MLPEDAQARWEDDGQRDAMHTFMQNVSVLVQLAQRDGLHMPSIATALRIEADEIDERFPSDVDLVRRDEATSYNDFGTLEGTLRAISDQSGSLEIRIHDPLWKRAIPCRVSDEQIDDAMSALRKRVEVAGVIHYNRLGRPTSIRMESLTALPDDSSLPTAADVRGILAGNA